MKVQDFITNLAISQRKATARTQTSQSFSNVMNSTQAAVKRNSRNPIAGKQKFSNGNSSSIRQKQQSKDISESVSQQNEKGINPAEVVKQTDPIQNQNLNEEVSSEKDLIESAIKEIITEDLQVTEEELLEAMSVLALEYMDLLDPENLKALTLNLKGAFDITDVLLDDDLSTMLTQVMEDITVENIAEKVGISTEEIEQLTLSVQEVKENLLMPAQQEETERIQTEEIKQPIADILSGEEAVSLEEVNENSNQVLGKQVEEENTLEEQQSKNSSLPEVSVVKETSDTKESMTNDFFGQKDSQNQEDLSQTVVNNIANSTVTETISSDGMITMTTVQMRQVVTQIVQQIRIIIRPEQTDMHMTLHPEHLGRLMLSVTAKYGVMTANFTVQNEMVKQAMEAQIQDLKTAFEEQGLKVEAVEVTIAAFEFAQSDQTGEENSQSNQKRQKSTPIDMEKAFLEELEEDSNDQAVAAISGTGSNVNYMA